jgi:4'-phosphopantetheinyl transferase
LLTASVDLWTIPLAIPCATWLSEEEASRASRFRFEADRVRWTRARSSLRQVLSGYLGGDPASVGFQYGAHGKPALLPVSEIEFNLSHAGEWAMVAVTRSIPVGVDLERIRANIDIAALLRRLGETQLPETIPALYQAWTHREAKSKAAGGALFDTPRSEARVADVTAPEGYAASVALIGYTPEIRYRGNR